MGGLAGEERVLLDVRRAGGPGEQLLRCSSCGYFILMKSPPELPDAVFTKELQGRYTFINRVAAERSRGAMR